MHYEDKQVIENALLEVVVYKHSSLIDDETQTTLTSIQTCRYIQPDVLYKFLKNFPRNFKKEIKIMKSEEFRLITFKVNEQGKLYIHSYRHVYNNESPFLRLH